MKIGVCGLGKLGTPVAVAIARRFPTMGYDLDCFKMSKGPYPHLEKGPEGYDDFQKYLNESSLQFADNVEDLVDFADIIFVAVQTPHQPEFDGTCRLTDKRADFDYTYLRQACHNLAPYVRPEQTIAVISTVLPGTMRREILPIFEGKCNVVYNPFFIAMGTVWNDFDNPEFVLIGEKDQPYGTVRLQEFYSLYYAHQLVPIQVIELESAELTKVAYNLAISQKITYANTLMEIAHKVPGCNVDDVVDTLGKATNRIISTKYMRGGLGDSGGCHPRDAIAMSWLARELNLSCNLFDNVMTARERQCEWLVDLFLKEAGNLPLVLLGKSFKPETNITAGSCALLIAKMLEERGRIPIHVDPIVSPRDWKLFPAWLQVQGVPRAFLVTTKHDAFQLLDLPFGSVVVDPHRFIPKQEGVRVVHVGVGE